MIIAALKMRGVLRVTFRPTPVGLVLETEQDKGVRMKSNQQARHLLGLNYKLSQQKKVVLEGDAETTVNHVHATGRKRRGG
jgi:stationary-phase-induced ribosome-associated protein